MRNADRFAYNRHGEVAAAVYSNGTLVVSNRYDHLGRRIQKIAADGTHAFLYDGWRPVVETVAKSGGGTDCIEYYWGKDLSGSLGGAAGVGGLLYVKRNGSIYVPFYDAYGNVMGYWDENGAVVAEYAYDAFGRTVAKSGTMADMFSVRYSTKYYDAETGMYYYGRRYYVMALCRWLTRDPIDEQGGVNLYGFCGNGPCYKTDFRGMFELTLISDDTVEGDVLLWYLQGGIKNTIKHGLHSEADVINTVEQQILQNHSLVTVLNLSGHGLSSGAGVHFLNRTGLDLTDENSRFYKSLGNYLAKNAVIKIWSCQAAETYEKCSGLQKLSHSLNAVVYAKTGGVMAGPDGGVIGAVANRIAAWVVGDVNTWRVFTPHPIIESKGYQKGSGSAYIIRERRSVVK